MPLIHDQQLIGRDAELARLRAVVDAARHGRSGVVALVAPPGAGKTAVLDAVAAEAADGVAVLRVTAIESERGIPFAALDALLRPALGHLDQLPDAQRVALEQALALRAAEGEVPQFAVAAAVTSLLGAASYDEPVLCLVDDLQWVDDASLGALLFAARRLRTEAVAMVLAARSEWADAALRGIERIELPPLAEADALALLGRLTDNRLPRETALRLVAAAERPLDLVELVRGLTPEQRDGREPLVGPPGAGSTATARFAERIAGMPEEARLALLIVAAGEDATPAEISRALAAAELSPSCAEHAEEMGLLRFSGARVVVGHPLVRAAAYHEATPARQRWAHAQLAAVMEEGDPRRAWHLASAAATPDEAIAAELDRQAAEARARGAYAVAARAARRAADLSADPTATVRRMLEAVRLFESASALREADHVLDEVERFGVPDVLDETYRGMRGYQAMRQGRVRDARRLLVEEGRRMAGRDDETAARFLVQAASCCVTIGDTGGCRDLAAEALALAGGTGTYAERMARAVHAAALIATGHADEAVADAEAVAAEVLGSEGRLTGPLVGYGILAQALIWIERFDLVGPVMKRLVEDSRAATGIVALPYLLTIRGQAAIALGRFALAEARAEEALTLSEAGGQRHFQISATALQGLAMACRGDWAGAEERARRTLEVAPDAAPRMVVMAQRTLGHVALGQGDVSGAVSWFTAASDANDRDGYVEPGNRPWEPELIEALIRADRLDEARARLDAWEAAGVRFRRPFVQATAARCRGLLAGDDAFEACFADALRLHGAERMAHQRAYTLLCLGERLRRSRRRGEAREPLREALDVFVEVGAEGWAARARSELRAAGGTPPVAASPKAAELTAHELQVAMMVAEGRTNKEVAAALFLAPKTIEHHLSAIFRKLGVKRRTELARIFAPEVHA